MSDPWEEQFNLAQAKHDEGDRAAAEALYEKALVACKKQHGTDHPHVAVVLNELARLLHSQRDFTDAVLVLRGDVAIRKKQLGPTHRRVAVALKNLALALMSKGDLAEAELLFQRAIAIHKDPEDVARVEKDLATVRRRIAKILERPGEESLKFATSLHALAYDKYHELDLAAAEPLCRRSLEIREKQLGDHADVQDSLILLADLLEEKGDRAAAEPLLRKALDIEKNLRGSLDHPKGAIFLAQLARVLRGLDKWADSEQVSLRAIAIFKKLGMVAVREEEFLRFVQKQLQLKSRSAVAAAAPPPAKRQKRSEEDDGAADRGEDDCVITGSRTQEERDAELKRNAIAVDSDAEEGARPTRASALEDQLKELRVKGVEFDIAAALDWCKKNGADELSEIVEADMVDDFVASLSLTGKPLLPVKAGLLKKRLRAVVAGG
jgi:tetratricopeptide (TPR) repeat protein